MNGARAQTGHVAQSIMANAYFNAAQYAKERVQGRPLTNPKGDRVTIINHEDVKKMLLHAKAHAEAMRGMIFQTYLYFDVRSHDPDEAERLKASDRIDVLTPLIKAYCSDEAWPIIGDCIQVYGGYGIAKISVLVRFSRRKGAGPLEGTNFPVYDVNGRMDSEEGDIFCSLVQIFGIFINSNRTHSSLEREFGQFGTCAKQLYEIQMTWVGYFGNKQDGMMPLYAHRILTATAQLYCGMVILSQALVAQRKLQEINADHFDYGFYVGKVAAARYYLMNIVPNVWAVAEIVKTGDTSCWMFRWKP